MKSRSRDRDFKRPQSISIGAKNVERWPNDKYSETDQRRDLSRRRRDDSSETDGRRDDRMGNEQRKRYGLGYNNQTKRQFETDIMDTRRTKREVIGREGTSSVWGKSPSPSDM